MAIKKPKSTPPKRGAPPTTKRKAKEAEIAERRQRVWEMRKSGVSVRKVAAALGIPRSTVQKDFTDEMEIVKEETQALAEEWRAMQIERIMEVTEAHLPIAMNPDDERSKDSAAIVARNEAMLSKLTGAEAPVKSEVHSTGGGDFKAANLTLQVMPAEPPMGGTVPKDIQDNVAATGMATAKNISADIQAQLSDLSALEGAAPLKKDEEPKDG